MPTNSSSLDDFGLSDTENTFDAFGSFDDHLAQAVPPAPVAAPSRAAARARRLAREAEESTTSLADVEAERVPAMRAVDAGPAVDTGQAVDTVKAADSVALERVDTDLDLSPVAWERTEPGTVEAWAEPLIPTLYGAPTASSPSTLSTMSAVRAPEPEAVRLTPNGQANLDGNLNVLLAQAYKIAFRLVGDPDSAHQIALDATRSAASVGDSASYRRLVGAASIRLALAVPAESGTTSRPDGVTHAQHRARLRRDLARYSERDRCVMALRHLSGMSTGLVAASMAIDDEVVRSVTANWVPEDANSGSDALLKGIDNWISSGDAEDETSHDVEPGSELSHLDDPNPPRFALQEVNDLGVGSPASIGAESQQRNGRRR